MKVLRSVRGALALAALIACTDATVEPLAIGEFPFASATPWCGPADGPAMAITLTNVLTNAIQPPAPFVRVFLWHAPAEVAGHIWTWDGDDFEKGSAVRCVAEGSCISTTEAQVTVGEFAADSSLDINVDLRFADASRLRGTVHARWVPRQFLCL